MTALDVAAEAMANAVAMRSTGDIEGAAAQIDRHAAALADLEALVEAAKELLGDDDMPNHWDDCVCSYCVRNRAVRAALARVLGTEQDTA